MLGGHDVEADVVSDKVFVQRLMIEIGGDLRVAVFVGQACAHGIGSIEHLLCDERISYLATVKGSHGRLSSDRHQSPRMNSITWAANLAGCSISGWWPAFSISAKRALGSDRNISRFAIGDPDANWIDQDQPSKLGRARHRRLGRKPAAEGKADQRDAVARYGIDEIKRIADEVINGVEVLGPVASTKPGSEGAR